jgi:hypothetical protein
MTAAAIPLEEELTPEQQLYRAEKARRAERVRPEMVAAAAELERIEQLARENGKGGRPKGSGVNVGKASPFRARTREPEPDAPGRPEWLTPPTPPKEPGPLPALARRPSPSSTPMTYEKTCKRSGRPFTSTAKTTQFCHECDECVAAKGEAPATKARKSKADKPKKRKPVRTGFRGEPPRSTRAAKSSSPAMDHVQEQIDMLDARREKLVAILDSLRELAEA